MIVGEFATGAEILGQFSGRAGEAKRSSGDFENVFFILTHEGKRLISFSEKSKFLRQNEGDLLGFNPYYHATCRLFELMRTLR